MIFHPLVFQRKPQPSHFWFPGMRNTITPTVRHIRSFPIGGVSCDTCAADADCGFCLIYFQWLQRKRRKRRRELAKKRQKKVFDFSLLLLLLLLLLNDLVLTMTESCIKGSWLDDASWQSGMLLKQSVPHMFAHTGGNIHWLVWEKK